jgi:YhcH/YjgK/YiaL family protein
MIYDTLEKLPECLPENIRKEIISFIENLSVNTPDGKHIIRGEEIFANVNSYETEPAEKRPWEAHRKYIDIQYVVSGSEYSQQFPVQVLAESDKDAKYDAAKDVILFAKAPEEVNAVLLSSGIKSFAVFFPQDAHKPQVIHQTAQKVKKVIFKIDAGLWKF